MVKAENIYRNTIKMHKTMETELSLNCSRALLLSLSCSVAQLTSQLFSRGDEPLKDEAHLATSDTAQIVFICMYIHIDI